MSVTVEIYASETSRRIGWAAPALLFLASSVTLWISITDADILLQRRLGPVPGLVFGSCGVALSATMLRAMIQLARSDYRLVSIHAGRMEVQTMYGRRDAEVASVLGVRTRGERPALAIDIGGGRTLQPMLMPESETWGDVADRLVDLPRWAVD